MTIGNVAPNFSLKNQNNEDVTLENYRGKKVMLVFYPKDDSVVCSTQLCEYNKFLYEFNDLGITILAVSTDSSKSHLDFASKRNLKIQLLSDYTKEVSKAYDVLGVFGYSKRAIFIIDEEGKFLYENIKLPVFYQKKAELIDIIKSFK